jgi:hypothetical protein
MRMIYSERAISHILFGGEVHRKQKGRLVMNDEDVGMIG